MTRIELVGELKKELSGLRVTEYRRQQQVWAEARQLAALKRLLAQAAGDDSAIDDFARMVFDIASQKSRLWSLTVELSRKD